MKGCQIPNEGGIKHTIGLQNIGGRLYCMKFHSLLKLREGCADYASQRRESPFYTYLGDTGDPMGYQPNYGTDPCPTSDLPAPTQHRPDYGTTTNLSGKREYEY